jgi:serine acetyltransferase
MIRLHYSVRVHPSARLNCSDLTIGAGGVIGAGCIVEGKHIEIGRDLWMDEGARIGGGSCNDPQAFLRAGDWLHLGKGSELNIARGITVGDEVGVGIGTSVFTHGAYLDELAGFPCSFAPVNIGHRVWLPNAWVNPGVTIGNDVVVAARSLVNRDLPEGCLAGGVPAVVLRQKIYPKTLTATERGVILDRIIDECRTITVGVEISRSKDIISVGVDAARFDVAERTIEGAATSATEIVRNQLRRHGIRFRFSRDATRYVSWNSES